MDVVAHNLADDLAKTLSKKERKVKEGKKGQKNKKSKNEEEHRKESRSPRCIDTGRPRRDNTRRRKKSPRPQPCCPRGTKETGPIDPVTDKRAKKNGFHGNEGGRRGPERMQSSVSIVEEVAEEEGDDEGADERLPRELEEAEEDIPDEIDETQAAALAHTALSHGHRCRL